MSTFQFVFDHAGLSVPDLDTSIAWYQRVLGFALERRYEAPTIPATIAVLANGSVKIELFQLADARPAGAERGIPNQDLRTHGHKHISFSVPDVLALSQEFERREVDIVWVRQFPFGTNMFIRDNSGNLIEFVERPTAPPVVSTL